LKVWINLQKGKLDDPKNITRDVSAIGHWGNGDYEIQISDDDNIEYIISLIKQSYNKNNN
jgi:predicted transport protein